MRGGGVLFEINLIYYICRGCGYFILKEIIIGGWDSKKERKNFPCNIDKIIKKTPFSLPLKKKI